MDDRHAGSIDVVVSAVGVGRLAKPTVEACDEECARERGKGADEIR